MSLCNYIQEIVSLVHVSVNNGVSVGDRQQRDFVQVLSGSVIRYVEAILLNWFLTFIKLLGVLKIRKMYSVRKNIL